MIREAISRLVCGEDLSPVEAGAVMDEIISGSASPAQIGAFIVAMRMKGESAGELAACARALRSRAVMIRPGGRRPLVDTCGTGGDGMGTFNISTLSAIVAAGAGVTIVKHGNRSASGRCGSADVLEKLGVRIDMPPERVAAIIESRGIGFLYAPAYHPAMKFAAAPRQELGIRSIFNLLGPLSNPAGADAQLLGVYDPRLTGTLAEVLRDLGLSRALVVHGNGLDEITNTGPTQVAELRDGRIRTYTLTPDEFGIRTAGIGEIQGGSAEENARIAREILAGREGAAREVVLLNAGAAIYLGGRAPDISGGIRLAGESIDSGAAREKLRALVMATEACAA
jgi:anthranilate phosphoribosyltransferase